MVLTDYKTDKGWLIMQWQLCYEPDWEKVLTLADIAGANTAGVEFFTADMKGRFEPVNAGCTKNLMKTPEKERMIVRGMSIALNMPLEFLFYNDNQYFEMQVPLENELQKPFFEKIEKIFGQFLSSLEIQSELAYARAHQI